MHSQNITPSICQNCRHYQPQGRRGGVCQMFQTFVESQWESCTLAELPFVYYLNQIEDESTPSEEVSPVAEIDGSAFLPQTISNLKK
ncbi:MAG: hypothetical protein WBA77_04610 [Microcoleaceae cyanobacterium]